MNGSFSELLYFSLHFDLSCAEIQEEPDSHDNIPSILSKNLCALCGLCGEYVTAIPAQST